MALQSKARSILVLLLVAIPVIGMSGLAIIVASNEATPAETARLSLGDTSARIEMVSAPGSHVSQDFSGNGGSYEESSGKRILSPDEFLPTGTRILSERDTSVVARTVGGIGYLEGDEGDLWDPALRGRYTVLSGTAPTADDQVMVTPATLIRLGVKVGGAFETTQPRPLTLTVVGTMTRADLASSDQRVFARAGAIDGLSIRDNLTSVNFYLPDLRVNWAQVLEYNREGAWVASREVILHPPHVHNSDTGAISQAPLEYLGIVAVGGFILFEVALLAGAAFAVGARQQQRALAILASVGGDGRMLFRVISFGGIVLGFVGALLGTALGTLAAAIAIPILSEGSQSRFPGFHVPLEILAAIVVLATIAAWIAAAAPARTAARTDVVAALRGARRPPRPTRRRPIIGVITILAGAAICLVGGAIEITAQTPGAGGVVTREQQSWTGIAAGIIVAGAILTQVGAILIAPILLRWAAALSRRVSTSAQLATRDAARNPSRSVPALAAIMSTVFVSVVVMNLLASGQVITNQTYQYQYANKTAAVSLYAGDGDFIAVKSDGTEVLAALDRAFGVKSARLLSSAPDPYSWPLDHPAFAIPKVYRHGPDYLTDFGGDDRVWVGTSSDLAAIMGAPVKPAASAALRAGGVVSLYPQFVRSGRVHLDWQKMTKSGELGATQRSVDLSAVVQRPPHPINFGMFMTPETASKIGLTYAPTLAIAPLHATPTDAQRDAMTASLDALSRGSLYLAVETGPTDYAAGWLWGLLAFSGLSSLGAAAIAIALARADGRRDDDVLESLGSPPTIRRGFGFWQAVVIAGIGSVIGVVLGQLPGIALGYSPSGNPVIPFAPPISSMLLAAIAIPLVIAAGTWLSAGRHRARFTRRSPAG